MIPFLTYYTITEADYVGSELRGGGVLLATVRSGRFYYKSPKPEFKIRVDEIFNRLFDLKQEEWHGTAEQRAANAERALLEGPSE